jgi:hypothetical protein
MPQRPSPLSGPELRARVAGRRGAAVLRATLLELLSRPLAEGHAAAREPWAPREATAWIGRRPEGWIEARASRRGGPLGRYFALAARLEAGAVEAFRDLGRELAEHEAPSALRREVDRAIDDAARHARVLTALARRFGGVVRAPRVRARSPRSLFELARHNAAEGCVREAFGALVALRQGRAAEDASVALIMGHIADDEIRHASLAFRVDRWAAARLGEGERGAVEEARRAAQRQLLEEAAHEPAEEPVALAGLPSAGEALALARGLGARLVVPS